MVDAEPSDANLSSTSDVRLDQLPLSITQHIASYLDERDALSLALTCRVLVDAGESRLYRILPLLYQSAGGGYQSEPDLPHVRYRPSAKALEWAKHYGDPLYQRDMVEWRLTNPSDNPFYTAINSPDILQGCLRYFKQVFSARPSRRKHVKEIYIDASQIKSRSEISRSFTSMGTLRAVEKLVVILGPGWGCGLSLAVALAPNVRNLTILTTVQRAEPEHDMTLSMSELRSLTIETISKREEKVIAQIIKESAKLTSVSIFSWSGFWRPSEGDPIGKALSERKGMINLILPKTALEPERSITVPTPVLPGGPSALRIGTTLTAEPVLQVDRFTKVRTLGIQADYPPVLRLTDLVIPGFPRCKRLILIKNRGSDSSPVQIVRELSDLPTPIPAAHIPPKIIEMLDAAPRLVQIEYPKSFELHGQPQDRVLIRTFTRAGESLTHIRVLAPHAFCEGRWIKDGSAKINLERKHRIWQDWTDFRGQLIPLYVLQQIYTLLGGIPKPGREMRLTERAWAVLERYISS